MSVCARAQERERERDEEGDNKVRAPLKKSNFSLSAKEIEFQKSVPARQRKKNEPGKEETR